MTLSPRDLLVSTFSLYRAHFWLLIGYAAWMILPVAAFLILTNLPSHPWTPILVILTFFAQLFVMIWLAVCIMRVTVGVQQNHSVDPNEISAQALRRIQPVLATAVLQTLIVLGGTLLLIVPGIIFWGWYALAQTAAAVDEQPAMKALATSRSLVQGRFWYVLWRLIAGPFVIGLLYAFALGSVLILVATLFGQDPAGVFSEQPPLWAQLLESGGDVFVIPLFIIYSVLLYEHLKATHLATSLASDVA